MIKLYALSSIALCALSPLLAEDPILEAIHKIVTETIVTPEKDLKLELPAEGEKEQKDTLYLKVDADGNIYFLDKDGKKMLITKIDDAEKADKLDTVIKEELAQKKDPNIKINANPEAKAQHVVDLIGVLSQNGITKISFQKIDTEEKEEVELKKGADE